MTRRRYRSGLMVEFAPYRPPLNDLDSTDGLSCDVAEEPDPDVAYDAHRDKDFDLL